MVQEPVRVVLDANVLFPFTLRDTLLRAAVLGLFQVYWSEEILEEARRNLVSTGRMRDEQVARLIERMRAVFPEALVDDYQPLIPSMPNDPKDRHVAAVAVRVGAQAIVTNNLKDFRQLPAGIEVFGPDDFLLGVLERAPAAVALILRRQAAALKNPPVTLDELLTGLGRTVPCFEAAFRERFAAPDEET